MFHDRKLIRTCGPKRKQHEVEDIEILTHIIPTRQR